jgi:CSLREA domain-containing protein
MINGASSLRLSRTGRRVQLGPLACAGLILALVALLSVRGDARAGATFVVTSAADVVGANPGNHVCETAAGNGVCTLRRAVIEANAWPGGGATIDLTQVPGGVVTLAIPASGSDDATTGDLNLTANTTIVGAGPATTIIDGNASVVHDRVLNVQGVKVSISGVTIRHGTIPTAFNDGAGILNSGTLTLVNSRVTDNSTSAAPTSGSGIASSGSLSLIGVSIDHNTGANGALYSGGSQLSILNSIIAGNQAPDGGGIICNDCTLTLTNSTVSSNTTTAFGGGVYVINPGATAIIKGSTIDNNVARFGAGVMNYSASTLVIDSTISGNMANEDGGGICNCQTGGTVGVYNSTITLNSADHDLNGSGFGGGLNNGLTSGAMTVQNSIVADNYESFFFAVAGAYIPTVGECYGSLVTSGANLMDGYNTSRCSTIGSAVTLAGPKLGGLQANGGSTYTHALLSGSPAINAGPLAGCTDNLGAPISFDQRGHPRPLPGSGGRCDLGAFEISAIDPHDFNSNGTADLLWRNPATGENGLWLMNGATVVGAQVLPSSGAAFQIAATADFDGDGHADILWHNPATGENGLWLMNGSTIVGAQALPGASPAWIIGGVADFDGDGRADIFWHNPTSGENGMWLMNGFAIVSAAAFPAVPATFQPAGVGDFDGDGRADILWRNAGTGEDGIWLMTSATIKSFAAIPGAPPAWIIAGVADFNGDGWTDIVWRNPVTGEDGMWLMNGMTIQSAQNLPPANTAWQIVETADFNGDGRADLLWHNPTTGESGIWLLNGASILAAQALPTANPAWRVR